MVEHLDNKSSLVPNSPRHKTVIAIPAVIHESAFGLIEKIEERSPDLGTVNFQRLVAAHIAKALIDGPEGASKVLRQYQDSVIEEVLRLNLITRRTKQRAGRPKNLQIHLPFN